ncbi:MAG: NADH-quinone oxidoreductase subunit J [Armatimonadota bacterium]
MIASLWHEFLAGTFWQPLSFVLLALGVLLPALAVVFSRNIVHSALWLLPCLVSVAGLFVLLGAEVLAGIQILIYCGGIVVLILFAVMLTYGVGDPDVRALNRQLWWGMLGVAAFASLLGLTLRAQSWPAEPGRLPPDVTGRLADALLGQYVLAFEVASVILLAAMVGALVVARAEPRE